MVKKLIKCKKINVKYYFLKNSSNLTEIGRFPQSETSIVRGKLHDLNLDECFNDLSLEALPVPLLHSKSKLTTLIDVSIVAPPTYFLAVREEMINSLVRFEIGSHQYWQFEVKHKQRIIKDYFLFYLNNSSEEQIVDYDLSCFFSGKRTDWKYKGNNIKISDHNEYKKILNSFRSTDMKIKLQELILDFRNVTQDLIRITDVPFGKGFYASERLKDEVLLKNYSGMEFIPVEKLTNSRVKCIY